MTKTQKERSKTWLRISKFLRWWAYKYNRLQVHGIENIPPKGNPALICANHPGLLDPGFMHISIWSECDRWMRWLGWAGIVNSDKGFVKWIVKNVETMVPVDEHEGVAKDRKESLRALDALARELQNGHLVGLFPEGKNHEFYDYKEPYKFRTGAIRLAAMSDVPIIPTAVYGSHRVWMTFGEIKRPRFHMWLTVPFWFPAKVHVAFGEPFYVDPRLKENLDDRDLVRAETERLKQVIYGMAEELYKA